MNAASRSNEGGASASPSGVNGARPRFLFNPANHRQNPAARAARLTREAALDLGNAGLPIFVASPSKLPIIKDWEARSTNDADEIERHWSRHPNALIGLTPGKVDLIVVDLDRHTPEQDGIAEAEQIVGDISALGCPVVMTGGGGLHLYFMQPPGKRLGNGRGALPKGIDVRGHGGFAIAPGSVRADGSEWQMAPGSPDLITAFVEGTIPELPEAFLRLIEAKPERERPEPPRRPATGGPRATHSASIGERERAYACKALDGEVRELAATPKGQRNPRLNEAALKIGHYVAAGWIGEPEVRQALEGACFANGLAQDDGIVSVRKTIDSGLRTGMQEPAPPLADRERPDARDGRETPHFVRRNHPDEARPGARHTIMVDGVTIDAETGEVLEDQPAADAQQEATGDEANTEQADPGHKQRGPRVELHTINAASLAGKPVPPQAWLVENMIPANNVTLFSGDGGTGKSLLTLQLAAAVATGGSWIGYRPLQGPAVYLSAEDEIDEVHRRLARIEPKLERLSALTIIPLAGEDSVLASPQGRDRLIQPTALFKAVQHVVAAHKPALLVLDTAADLYAGNENARNEVRAFISLLRGVCLKQHVTVVLLFHPSQTGLASGTGDSGSTSWKNSVRSQLYFSRRIIERVEDDPDLRVLEQKKSNRSRIGGQITVRWKLGRFVREAESALNARDAMAKASNIFLALLALFASNDRTVSDRRSPSFAPTVFAKHPDAEGITKGQFEKAMERLFRDGMIAVEEVGPLSRRHRRIVLANPPQPTAGGGEAAEEQPEEASADDG